MILLSGCGTSGRIAFQTYVSNRSSLLSFVTKLRVFCTSVFPKQHHGLLYNMWRKVSVHFQSDITFFSDSGTDDSAENNLQRNVYLRCYWIFIAYLSTELSVAVSTLMHAERLNQFSYSRPWQGRNSEVLGHAWPLQTQSDLVFLVVISSCSSPADGDDVLMISWHALCSVF